VLIRFTSCAIRVLIVLCGSLVAYFAAAAADPQPQNDSAFQRLQQRASDASAQNRLDRAARLYTQALGLRPRWADGWWSLGTLEYDQNHFSKAALAFKKLIQLQPKNGTAHAMLGLCQFELGADERALTNLVAADRLGIVNNKELRDVALYHLGVLQLRIARFGDAYQTLHDAAQDGIKTKELFVALGQAALLINPRKPAETNQPVPVIESAGEAESFSAQEQFAEAEASYSALATQFPDYPNLHFAYGRMLLEARKENEALEEFRRELQRDPQNVNSMLEIASVEYQQDSQDGLKYAEKAVELSPSLPFAHYILGMLRLDTGDSAGAIPELEIVRKAFPKQASIYYSLGNAYARSGRKEEAARVRAEFVRLDAEEKRSQSNVSVEQASGLFNRKLWVERNKPAE
jgi:tetratricopeptide (TPR) repeat protein